MQCTGDSFFIKTVLANAHTADSSGAVPDSLVSCTFYMLRDGDRYASENDDPYSIVYNKWRVKPLKPETPAQLKAHVLYNWFNTPLIIASNGVALKYYREISTDWSKNFYDTAQARTAYWILNDAFSTKINFLQTDNVFEKKVDMFNQMIDNIKRH